MRKATNPAGGGCKVVISKVEEANNQNIQAFGIVDRDVLLSDANDLFWEPDDTKFRDAQPYGDKIHVLRRWELENYLLQPEAFADEVARRILRSPAPNISAETLLQTAEEIIQVTALTTFSVAKGKKSPNTAFGTNIPPGSDLTEEINKYLRNQFSEESYDICNDIEKIKAFDKSNGNPAERWDNLSRILDGKKSLMRLCRHLCESLQIESIRPWEEMRGCLANVIASRKTIDSELVNLIENIGNI